MIMANLRMEGCYLSLGMMFFLCPQLKLFGSMEGCYRQKDDITIQTLGEQNDGKQGLIKYPLWALWVSSLTIPTYTTTAALSLIRPIVCVEHVGDSWSDVIVGV